MLTQTEHKALAETIEMIEKQTSAEIVIVLAKTSDAYVSAIVVYGIALASLIDLALWQTKILMNFPILLLIQLGITAVISVIPHLRNICIRLLPKSRKYQRAAARAYTEYLSISHQVPSGTPILLLYVSHIERYAHILTSRCLRKKIPQVVWDSIIADFMAQVLQHGLGKACIGAVKRSGDLLITAFPNSGHDHAKINHMIETD